MQRLNHLWPQVTDFSALYAAFRQARRGKAARADVCRFEMNLEPELLALQQQLQDGSYTLGDYRLFTVYERKPRLIAAAPFRDRVVHHAVMRAIEPHLDRRLIDDTYACRKGRGVHRAVDRYQHWAQRYRYVLKLDISRYFPSISHTQLKQQLQCAIKDQRLMQLIEQIIDHAPLSQGGVGYGLPIGNLTSQFFANWYLNRFDHRLKEVYRVPAYLRYVDDLFLLDDSKERLWSLLSAIQHELSALELCVHPHKIQLSRTGEGIDVLGYRIWPQRRALRNDNGHRFARRLRALSRRYAVGMIDFVDTKPAVHSWIGHARHAETQGLRATIFAQTPFIRATQENA